MKTRYFYWLVLLIAAHSAAHAQSKLQGTVTDSLTGEALPGVNVSLPEIDKGTLSGADGAWELRNLPKGTFRIQFRMEEYKTVVRTVTLSGADQTLNFALSPMVVESHGIIISGAFPTEQDNNPVEVIQFDKEDMLKTGEPTLMGSLATKPGISQVSTGVGIGKPVIRGLSSNRVLVYTQGVRLENQQWGDEHGLGVSDIGISKVEVIKGPSSLLYGSDAMGGVIHVIEEEPAMAGTIGGDAGVSLFSNTLGGSADAGLKGSGKIFRAGVRAGYRNHADYQTGGNYRVGLTRFNEQVIKTHAGITLPWLVSNLRYSYNRTNVGIPDGLASSGTSRDLGDLPHQELGTHLLTLQNLLLAGKHKFKVNAGYILNQRAEYEFHDHGGGIPDHVDRALDMNLGTATYDVKWQSPTMGRLDLTAGLQGMFQRNTNRGEELLIPDAQVADAGVLAVARLAFSKLQFQGGLRADHRSISTPEMGVPGDEGYFVALQRRFSSVNGAAGLVLNPGGKWLMRFNVASGFRAPNLAELHSNGVHHGTLRYEVGDVNLKQERNAEADLGFHFHSDHLTAEISLFNNYIRDYIYLAPQDTMIDSTDVFAYVQGDANLNGGEAGIDIHPHPLDWLHLEFTGMLVNARRVGGDALPLIPPVRLTASVRGEFKKLGPLHEVWVNASAVQVLAQRAVSAAESETPGYFLLNASAGFKTGSGEGAVELIIAGNNLLNAAYFDHLSRLRRDNIYNIGRNITITARVPFVIKKNSGV